MSRRLIEEWLPIAALGIESIRERTPMTPFPAPNRLHVWWARRPLVAARAAVMASLLPADADRDKFLRALGIHGDPVEAKTRIAKATREGVRLGAQAYGYPRAFSYSPTEEEKTWLNSELNRGGIAGPASVLDPTAGGGSIPFETLRLGQTVFCNDINPVAALIEKLTLEQPFFDGVAVYDCFRELGAIFVQKMREELSFLFPPEENADLRPDGYLFARTIRCPHCGGLVPLSPNWRLAPDGTGVKVVPHVSDNEAERVCTFEIVHKLADQSEGTVKGGRAVCPYPDCERVIESDDVKKIARAGGMGEQLYAVVYRQRVPTTTKSGKPGRDRWIRGYRASRPEDDVFGEVKERLAEKLPLWEALDYVPTEAFPEDSNDDRPIQYGMPLWRDLFSPRQLYCHATSVEVFRELLKEEEDKPGFGEVQKAAFAYLALAIDTVINYGTRSCRWDSTTSRVRSLFDRHDFAFVPSYAEMAPLIAGLGYDWAIEKTGKCIEEFLELLRPDIDIKSLKKAGQKNQGQLLTETSAANKQQILLSCQSADNLDHIADASIDAIVMDPPYYDNVMYAELSDFFYVWLKRTAGYVYPQLFTAILTDKENEAVANPARYKGEKKARELACADYRQRMAAIFGECRRVLKEDGVLLLMFTHKATGAWDALTRGLMEAGFAISASWPVNTEAEGSLHIRDKAAANSTIFLVCRPRPQSDGEMMFWEELEPQVRAQVLKRVESFRQAGIGGIDLYLASFGPGLEVFSRHWPVRRGSPRPEPQKGEQAAPTADYDPYLTTPEDALAATRAAVKDWSLRQILNIQRQASLDPLLEWFILAWHTFRSPVFPYDEALNLARVAGLDMEKDIIGVVAEKKASDVILWDSVARANKASLGSPAGSRSMLDSLHHAAYACRRQNLSAGLEFVQKHNLDKELKFQDALRAALEVLPPSRQYTGSEAAEALAPSASDFEVLENLRRLAFAEKIARPRQLSLWE